VDILQQAGGSAAVQEDAMRSGAMNMRIAAAGLSLVVAACGGGAGPQGPEPPPVQTGSIRGSVVDDANVGVAAVSVQLTRPGQSTRTATTSATGAYGFASVEAGGWTVTAAPPTGFTGAGALSSGVQVSAGAEAVVAPFVLRRSSTPPPAGDATVNMVDNAFDPATVTIAAGRSVRWLNTGTQVHNSVGAAWTSPNLNPGQSFERTFGQAGTFRYDCTLHPGMTGTVVVQ
jgi:plastocyanin